MLGTSGLLWILFLFLQGVDLQQENLQTQDALCRALCHPWDCKTCQTVKFETIVYDQPPKMAVFLLSLPNPLLGPCRLPLDPTHTTKLPMYLPPLQLVTVLILRSEYLH